MCEVYDNSKYNQEDFHLVDNIRSAKDLYDRQAIYAADAVKLEELAFNNYINAIKNYKSRYDYPKHLMELAWDEQDKKYKKERPNFHSLESMIQEDFFKGNKDFKLKNITLCGYDGFGYTFNFICDNQSVDIFIPLKSSLNSENLEYAYYGKFAFSIRKDEYTSEICIADYQIDNIANYISKYFSNKQVVKGENNGK